MTTIQIQTYGKFVSARGKGEMMLDAYGYSRVKVTRYDGTTDEGELGSMTTDPDGDWYISLTDRDESGLVYLGDVMQVEGMVA